LADLFKIRPARRGDREAIAAMLRDLGYTGAADSSTLFWVLNHPEIDVFVAADNLDRAIGFISLSHRPQLRMGGRVATVDELAVAEAWRNKGVGSRLLTAAIERARALSARRVEMTTEGGHKALRRGIFDRAGFVEVDRVPMRLKSLD
jgi:N-acetylglutamate synthase-like GNAT family acetyltransferase